MRRVAGFLLCALILMEPAGAGIEVRRDSRGQVVVGNLPAGTYAAPASPRNAGPVPSGADAELPAGRDLMPLIREAAARHRLPPELLRAVVEVESAFDPRAVSRKGARGLMQLMPGTASDLGVSDVYDPRHNLDGGARYLRVLLDAFEGDLRLALAAYNAGPEAVRRHAGVPPYRETRDYIEKVLSRLQRAPASDAAPRIYRYRDASGRLVISNLAPGSMGRQVGSALQPASAEGEAR